MYFQHIPLVLICLSTILHTCVYSNVYEIEEKEIELVELTYDNDARFLFYNTSSSKISLVAEIIGGVIAVAAVAPPQLEMFPPQGVPPPGAVSGGGGVLPATNLAVRPL